MQCGPPGQRAAAYGILLPPLQTKPVVRARGVGRGVGVCLFPALQSQPQQGPAGRSGPARRLKLFPAASPQAAGRAAAFCSSHSVCALPAGAAGPAASRGAASRGAVNLEVTRGVKRQGVPSGGPPPSRAEPWPSLVIAAPCCCADGAAVAGDPLGTLTAQHRAAPRTPWRNLRAGHGVGAARRGGPSGGASAPLATPALHARRRRSACGWR